jgi:hypothetical protein
MLVICKREQCYDGTDVECERVFGPPLPLPALSSVPSKSSYAGLYRGNSGPEPIPTAPFALMPTPGSSKAGVTLPDIDASRINGSSFDIEPDPGGAVLVMRRSASVVRSSVLDEQDVVMRNAGFGNVLYVDPRLVYLSLFVF